MLCNSKIEMTLMTPQLCRKLVQNLPHMKLKQKIKEREKRAEQKEADKKMIESVEKWLEEYKKAYL